MLLENDQFLSRMTLMFDRSRGKGNISICMKRYDGRTKPIPKSRKADNKKKGKQALCQGKLPPASAPHPEPSEYMCLVRAVFKSEKISTVIHAKEVNKFQLAYCNLLKSNMDGLKRQKKQKVKKATQWKCDQLTQISQLQILTQITSIWLLFSQNLLSSETQSQVTICTVFKAIFRLFPRVTGDCIAVPLDRPMMSLYYVLW